jgi:hypothetical protein
VRRVASPAEPPIRPDPNDLDALVRAYTHQPGCTQCFRCQATEARRATEPLVTWEPAQYGREINGGNVTIGRFLRVAAHAGSAGIA